MQLRTSGPGIASQAALRLRASIPLHECLNPWSREVRCRAGQSAVRALLKHALFPRIDVRNRRERQVCIGPQNEREGSARILSHRYGP